MLRRHRKLSLQSSVHFVTTVTSERGSWFVQAPVCREILGKFERCRHRIGVVCMGYVLMPDHFHALVQQTAEGDQVSELMRAFKHSTSRDFRLRFGAGQFGAGHVKTQDTRRRENVVAAARADF